MTYKGELVDLPPLEDYEDHLRNHQKVLNKEKD